MLKHKQQTKQTHTDKQPSVRDTDTCQGLEGRSPFKQPRKKKTPVNPDISKSLFFLIKDDDSNAFETGGEKEREITANTGTLVESIGNATTTIRARRQLRSQYSFFLARS